MKNVIISVLFLVPICVFAVEHKTKTRKQISAHDMAQMIYQRTGGKIIRPGTMNGSIVLVNAQSLAPEKWFNDIKEYLYSTTKFQIKIETGKFEFPQNMTKGNLTLYIIDNAEFPSVLHAPNSGWAVINVVALKHPTKPQFFEARVKKHLTRTFAMLVGAQNSSFPNSIMNGMKTPQEVDKIISHKLPIDIISRFNPYVAEFGITPAREVPYIQAVREGWAPAPTNDIQKAIWDKIHAMPTAPIKIKPETKKVRE